jgi:uncharacterized protein YrrD
MMIEVGLTVLLSDEREVGRLCGVVIDPVTCLVTDIIVRQWFLFSEDKVVPVHLIETETEDYIRLHKTASNLEDLADFNMKHFILLDENEMQRLPYEGIPALYYTGPTEKSISFNSDDQGLKTFCLTETETGVLDRSISLEEEARVVDLEGNHVGVVERVIARSKPDHVSHLLLKEGVFKNKKKLVPMRWISNLSEDEIQLAVGSLILEQLPDFT